jgi:hypothetical protein
MDNTVIPGGMYCYTIESICNETGRMKIALCPYWKYNKDTGMAECLFLQVTDDILLDDKCKICEF